MKNALVVLNESGVSALSENHLSREMSKEAVETLLNFMTDHVISELYPVEGNYDLALLSYDNASDRQLQFRLGEAFRYLQADPNTHGDLIAFITDALASYDRIMILKSNVYGWEETAANAVFHRLSEFDGVVGSSVRGDVFLLAAKREDLVTMVGLERLTQDVIDRHADASGFHFFFVPRQPVVEDLAGLTMLRETLPPESGMARAIDSAVLAVTSHTDETESV